MKMTLDQYHHHPGTSIRSVLILTGEGINTHTAGGVGQGRMPSSSMTTSCIAGRVHHFTRDGDVVVDIWAWDQEKLVDEEHEHLRPRQVVADGG